jgi:hypothetical protein
MAEAVRKNKTVSVKRNHLNFALPDISSSEGEQVRGYLLKE